MTLNKVYALLYIFRHQLSILVSSSLHGKRLHLLHGWTASPVGSISRFCRDVSERRLRRISLFTSSPFYAKGVEYSGVMPHIPSYCPDVLKLSETDVSNMQEKKLHIHIHIYIYISTIVLGMNGPTQTASLLQEASNSHTSTSISHFALSCASCSTLLHIAPPIVSEISLLFRSFQIY